MNSVQFAKLKKEKKKPTYMWYILSRTSSYEVVPDDLSKVTYYMNK